jgi:hypothetical protein
MTAAATRPGQSPLRDDGAKPPALAQALGAGGLVPFAGLALVLWLVPPDPGAWVALALVGYGALIVSFLGGIHWGVAMAQGLATTRHLAWGVAPSLLAWPALLMPAHAALPWLGLLLIVCYGVDRRLYVAAGLRAWLTLRWRLSMVAALSCFIAAGAT